MARFTHRTKRLARQRESAAFRHVVMPIAILVGFIGLLAVGLILTDHLLHNRWEAEIFTAAVITSLVPAAVFLLRWMRGHFNRQLGDP